MIETLETIQNRVLWLATNMIHHANYNRPNPDGSKVGGHQASSASMVTILTALYFHYLNAGDLVSVPAQDTVTVDMPVGGGAVTVKLFDANGTEVGSQPLGSVGGGRQELDVSTLTNGLPDGHYRYEVEAVNADGDSLAVQTYTKAVIEGMRFTPQGLRLIADGIEIPFSAVAELGLGT